MNVLLLLATVIGLAGLTLAMILTFIMGARWRAALLGAAAVSWAGLYGAGVLLTSLTSHETLLPPGATKRFCGFYFDCHIGVAVLRDVTAPRVAGRTASGRYHVLTLRFSSNARRETLTPYDLRIEVADAHGHRYARDLAAEAALAGGTAAALTRPIRAGGSYEVQVVFDLPLGVVEPRLFVGEGLGIDQVIEGMLMGDEDSFLHRKTLLALPGESKSPRV